MLGLDFREMGDLRFGLNCAWLRMHALFIKERAGFVESRGMTMNMIPVFR